MDITAPLIGATFCSGIGAPEMAAPSPTITHKSIIAENPQPMALNIRVSAIQWRCLLSLGYWKE